VADPGKLGEAAADRQPVRLDFAEWNMPVSVTAL